MGNVYCVEMASRASQEPSKKILFFRNFSNQHDVQNIREFFRREAGGSLPTVEFYKEAEDKIFLALEFESKDQAKEIKRRFDGEDVLGDNVQIQFFKNYSREPRHDSNYRYDGREHNGYRDNSRNRKPVRDASPYRNGYETTKYSHYRKESDPHIEKNVRSSRNKDRKRQTRESDYSSESDSNRSPVGNKKISHARSSSSSSDSSNTEAKSKNKPKKKLKRKNRSPSPQAEANLRHGRYSPTHSRSASKSPPTSKTKKHSKVSEQHEDDKLASEIYVSHDTSVETSGNF